MAPIPNHIDVVQRVNLQYPHLLQQNTLESCGQFTEIVVAELARLFPMEQWGHVGKSPGQTQYMGHAIDACMSRLDLTKAIDIIVNSNNPPAVGSPAWQEVPSGGQPWKPPIPVNGGNGGNHDCNCQEEIANLQNQINTLNNELQSIKSSTLQYGSKAAFKMSEGLVVNFENGGGTEPNEPLGLQTRSAVGAHEIIEFIRP